MSYNKVKLKAIESCFTALQLTLRDLYLEGANEYLTYSRMAEHKGVSVALMQAMLEEGRTIHNDITEQFKQT